MIVKVGDLIKYQPKGHVEREGVVSEIHNHPKWPIEVSDSYGGAPWNISYDEVIEVSSSAVEVGTFPFLNPGEGRV